MTTKSIKKKNDHKILEKSIYVFIILIDFDSLPISM